MEYLHRSKQLQTDGWRLQQFKQANSGYSMPEIV